MFKHGEYGIALENLCSIVEEKKIEINKIELQESLELFKIMKFEEESIIHYSNNIRTHQDL